MQNLPFTFRDFIIYFVPGIILLVNLLFFLNLFIDLQFLLDFISKNQNITLLLSIPICYVIGITIASKKITDSISKYKCILNVKNFTGDLSSQLKDLKNTACFGDILNNALKDSPFQEIENNLIWYMVRQIEIKDTPLTGNIERVNSLRNLQLQIVRVSAICLIADIFCCVTYWIISYVIKYNINLNISYIAFHLIGSYIVLYSSCKRFNSTSNWLLRLVIMSYHSLYNPQSNCGIKKLISFKKLL